MPNLLSAVLAGAMLFASVNLSAARENEGVIAHVDMKTRILVMRDGTRWLTADDVDLSGLAAGDMVQLTVWEDTEVITSIEKIRM